MSKHKPAKKKRNKAYTGNDAASERPVVHRYHAEVKSPVREWWDAKKGPAKLMSIVLGLVAFISWLLFEAVRIIF